jgi:succinyl-CoA synthetase beta subunit
LGGPVVLKIASLDIEHKSDLGGVRLDLDGPDAVRAAWREIIASVQKGAPRTRIDGILVAPMRKGGIELFVGVARDPDWGHVIAVGMGGVWMELLSDTSIRPLPVSEADVVAMLGELRAAPLLQGYRGSARVDLQGLAATIVAIGNAALALGDDLASLEVNPLLVGADRIEALDALALFG